jgi:hypothetical protein
MRLTTATGAAELDLTRDGGPGAARQPDRRLTEPA